MQQRLRATELDGYISFIQKNQIVIFAFFAFFAFRVVATVTSRLANTSILLNIWRINSSSTVETIWPWRTLSCNRWDTSDRPWFTLRWRQWYVFFKHLSMENQKVRLTVCARDLDKLNTLKLAYGGLGLGSSQCLLLPELPQKNDTRSKSGQKWLKKIILLCKPKSATHFVGLVHSLSWIVNKIIFSFWF